MISYIISEQKSDGHIALVYSSHESSVEAAEALKKARKISDLAGVNVELFKIEKMP